MDRESIWARRNTLFDVVILHKLASTIPDYVVIQWCINSAARCHQMSGGSLVESALWLRRAERMGASNSPEAKKEAAELRKLTAKTAESSSLPPVAEQVSPEKYVGESERGHCNLDRMRIWIGRLQRRFDFIERVARLRP